MAGAIAVAVNSGCYDLTDSIVGATLLITLYSFGWHNRVKQAIPLLYSSLVAICVVLLIGAVLDNNLYEGRDICASNHWAHVVVWLGTTATVYLILKLSGNRR
jgi:hypothetical protein